MGLFLRPGGLPLAGRINSTVLRVRLAGFPSRSSRNRRGVGDAVHSSHDRNHPNNGDERGRVMERRAMQEVLRNDDPNDSRRADQRRHHGFSSNTPILHCSSLLSVSALGP